MRDPTDMIRAELEDEVLRLRAAIGEAGEPWPAAYDLPIWERLHDAVIITDSQWCITQWNAAAERFYGWRRQDVLGRSVGEVVPVARYLGGDTRGTAVATLASVGAWRGEVVQLHREGHELFVDSSVQRLGGGQDAAAYVAINRDIGPRLRLLDERARLYEDLRSQAELQMLILNQIGDAVIVFGTDGRPILFNAAAERLLSAEIGAVDPERWSETFGLFMPDRRTIYPTDLLPAALSLAGEPVDNVEIFVRPPDKTDGRWVIASARPLVNAAGALSGGVVVSRDITERKRAEERLTRHTERLEMLQEIDQIILNARRAEDVAGVVVRRLRRVVPCDRARVFLYDAARGQLRTIAVDVEPGDAVPSSVSIDVSAADLASPLWSGRPLRVPDVLADPQLAHRAEDYRRFGIRSLLNVPLVAHGAVIGVLYLGSATPDAFADEDLVIASEVADQLALGLHSIALRVQLQAELAERTRAERHLVEERAQLARRVEERTADLRAANAELARVARLKDEFLANMSHELRTPLNSVLGRAELLREEVYGPLNERQQSAVAGMEEGGRHLLELINDVLDLAKIEAGRLELATGVVDVAAVCNAAVRMMSDEAAAKQVVTSLTLDSGVETIVADERRLRQILVNLMSNAVKFTPQGGSVGLEVRGDAERQVVTFTVWDTGIGIAAEDQKQLFQPFVQIDSALGRQHAGTGLGLALVLHLASLHDGGVSVASAPGEGSRFTVTLPWRRPAQQAAPPPPPAAAEAGRAGALGGADGAGPLVLLAEDSEANIALLSEYLAAAGYRVAVARNGVEAVERAEELRPALVLMDIQMPLMDGLEATRRIRAVPDLRDTRIIALTALAMRGDRERCLAAGADEYLAKPMNLRLLLQTIAAQLGGPPGA